MKLVQDDAQPEEMLLNIIKGIDLSAEQYRAYLTSGSKQIWDKYIVEDSYAIGICLLHDADLLDPKYDTPLREAIKTHARLIGVDRYPNKAEEVLQIIHQIKKIMLPITMVYLKKYKGSLAKFESFNVFKETYIKKLDPQFYSLLQNQVG